MKVMESIFGAQANALTKRTKRCIMAELGAMAERSNAPVPKTGIRVYRIGGSNPPCSVRTVKLLTTFDTPPTLRLQDIQSLAIRLNPQCFGRAQQ